MVVPDGNTVEPGQVLGDLPWNVSQSALDESDNIEADGDKMEQVDYSKFTIPMLKGELRWRGLRVGGNKPDLWDRLRKATTT